MASELVILSQAQRDVEEIVRYLARDLASPSAAARFLDEFDAKAENVCAIRLKHRGGARSSRMPIAIAELSTSACSNWVPSAMKR